MAKKAWALYRLEDGYIDNLIAYDDETDTYTPAEGYAIVEIPNNGVLVGEWSMCNSGWSYINGEFIEPPKPEEPEEPVTE